MRAFVVEGPHRHGLASVPDPRPGPGEVLVAPIAVGICGSDLELLSGRRPADYVRYPVVPGHEWSGRVVAHGPGVRGLEPGQPVVAEGVRACGRCDRCAEGRSNLCAAEYAETGFTHPGAMAELLTVPARGVHRLPEHRPAEPAALVEPAACVASGLLEVGLPAAGSRLAVVGDGPLGQLAVLLLRLSSPGRLLLVGSRPARLAMAKECGATEVCARDEVGPDLQGAFDLVVEATNAPSGAVTALALARRGGTVVLLGISGTGRPALDPDAICLGQLRVQGGFASSPAAWRWVVSLYAAGLFDPTPLITHRFALDKASTAFEALTDRDAGALKVLVRP